jgi:hypothetical protein
MIGSTGFLGEISHLGEKIFQSQQGAYSLI